MARKALTPEQKVAAAARHARWLAKPGNRQLNLERARAWGPANRDRKNRTALAGLRKRRYGVTPEQVEVMRAEQNNKCGICAQSFTATPCVDHCHTTGAVRGLLCRKCNSGLGQFGDLLPRVEAAATYLRKHQQGA